MKETKMNWRNFLRTMLSSFGAMIAGLASVAPAAVKGMSGLHLADGANIAISGAVVVDGEWTHTATHALDGPYHNVDPSFVSAFNTTDISVGVTTGTIHLNGDELHARIFVAEEMREL